MSRLYDLLPTFAQDLACSVVGYRNAQVRYSPHFHRVLSEWERNLSASDAELRAIQRDRLVRAVQRARTCVPFYRDLPPPSSARDPSEAIQSTLASIPPLDKGTYRAQPEAFLASDVPRSELTRGRTSGTTGTALPLWHTREAIAEEYATVWRMRRSCGVDLNAPHASFGGQIIVPFKQTGPPFWRVNHYGHQVLFSIYHMAPQNLGAYVEAIHAANARYVQGYPSALHLIARAMLERGHAFAPGQLAAVFTSSESLLAFHRETIEKAFGAPIWDRYGTSEFAVSMTACRERRLHVDMEFCVVEVDVREETHEYQRGPLLVTGLSRDGAPFLRYRIGDVGTRLKRPCPCGRAGDVFLDLDGRIEDYVITPDGRPIGRLDHIFKEQLDVAEAQIRQETKDAIELLVVPWSTYTPESERKLLREVRSRLGDELAVSIRIVEAIPRESNGKFRAVKSRIGRNAP